MLMSAPVSRIDGIRGGNDESDFFHTQELCPLQTKETAQKPKEKITLSRKIIGNFTTEKAPEQFPLCLFSR